MTAQEIQWCIDNGRVCVDRAHLPEYPGWVRKIIFYRGNRVVIEFVGHWVGDDEIGYEYKCNFPTLQEAIESIEDFLQKPVSEWVNYTKTGYQGEEPDMQALQIGTIKLEEEIANNKVNLPKIGRYKKILNIVLRVAITPRYRCPIQKRQ